jgi:hypothetical protein
MILWNAEARPCHPEPQEWHVVPRLRERNWCMTVARYAGSMNGRLFHRLKPVAIS